MQLKQVASLLLSACYLVLLLLVSPWAWAWPQSLELASYEGHGYQFKPLSQQDARAFLAAYEGDTAYLRQRLGWGWPPLLPSPEQNADMVNEHLRQRAAGEGYTYLIVSQDRREVKRLVGAVYLVPVLPEREQVQGLEVRAFDAELSWWINPQGQTHEQYAEFWLALTEWLQQSQSLQRILVPVYVEHDAAIALLNQTELLPVASDEESRTLFYQLRLP